jgi:hypothetical protein
MTVAQADGVKAEPIKLAGKSPVRAQEEEVEQPVEKPVAKTRRAVKEYPVTSAPEEVEESAEPEVRKPAAKATAVPAAKSKLADIVSDWDDE